MLHSTVRRALQTAGVLVSVGAVALTCASTASAATPPKPSTATAQAFTVVLPGAQVIGSPAATAYNPGKGDLDRQSTGNTNIPTGTGALSAGVAGATAVAKRNGVSFSCAGIVQPGGTISVGTSPASCSAAGGGTGAKGIYLNLKSLLGPSLPLSVGDLTLYFNGVTAFASQTLTGFTGAGKPINTRLVICPGIKIGDSCSAKLVRLPIIIKGDVNEDLLPAVLNAISAGNLGILGTTLSNALRPALQIRTNVQTHNDGVFKVVGVQVQTTFGAAVNLGVAKTGPNM